MAKDGDRAVGCVVELAISGTSGAALLRVGIETFTQLPNLFGRQLEHLFPAFVLIVCTCIYYVYCVNSRISMGNINVH